MTSEKLAHMFDHTFLKLMQHQDFENYVKKQKKLGSYGCD